MNEKRDEAAKFQIHLKIKTTDSYTRRLGQRIGKL